MKKVIVLTGASSGIGAATAKALSNSPHVLVMLARNEEKMKAIAAEINCISLVIKTDVTKIEEVQKAIATVIEKFGGIDVLINNAGLGYFDPIDEGKLEEWHTMIDVNLKGLLNITHGCIPLLKTSENGHIINITSVAAHQVFPNSAVYSATKHAVLAISKGLHQELQKDLKVTSISPGAVNTAFVNQTTNKEMIDDLKSYFAKGMQPDTIAQQIVYALEQPKDVTISEIIVRPGRT
ncbi:MAG: SDR family oxidoreductase [Salibacteraceae bacterium]|nr:SDR family oxidoreductase [Salibacteraceae bacterium]|tara:strand:+ start:11793 stop:12503 length:711 start_codon:yes stop_codon:yes gene_type:complete